MAAQKDMQDLLRLLTTGRNKIPMLAAMGRVKALQDAKIRSISDIAASDLPTLSKAIADEKAAKSLLAACKLVVKSSDGIGKRASTSTESPSSKRLKSVYSLPSETRTPAELEALLALPQPSEDEEAISKTTIYTNRAPLVLAFAVHLLGFTMPEQPLSGRLSLAQAVVSANSKSKAVSIGIDKGNAEAEGWGMGQPKVRVMGREVSVLKRSGYEWKDAENTPESGSVKEGAESETQKPEDGLSQLSEATLKNEESNTWTVSTPITSKQSTFIARSISITSPSDARIELRKLITSNPDLREASHNITAWRCSGSFGILEESNDDGESGGGRHILGVLQESNINGVLLVVSRWYGGIMLGPDRWRIMTQVSRDALSQRLRVAGEVGREALWGLDLEAMKKTDAPVTGGTAGGMPIHKPEGARAYILKAFGSPPETADGKKKKSGAALDREKEENLGLLLGALNLLFASWAGHISAEELDRRAWSWYVRIRPDVEAGAAGWGGKGVVKLEDILKLRRTED